MEHDTIESRFAKLPLMSFSYRGANIEAIWLPWIWLAKAQAAGMPRGGER